MKFYSYMVFNSELKELSFRNSKFRYKDEIIGYLTGCKTNKINGEFEMTWTINQDKVQLIKDMIENGEQISCSVGGNE